MDPVTLGGLVGVCGLIVWQQQREERARAPRPRARSGAGAAPCRCPYCHEGLGGRAALRRCPRCATRHHQGCWEDHGGCSVFGCERPGARPATRPDAQPVAAGPAFAAPVAVAEHLPPAA